MIPDPLILTIPLETNEDGTIHVRNSRVTLDTIIARHRQGLSPESINERFPTVPINDIYAVIAYYLTHKGELDLYLQQRNEEAEQIRQKIEANYTPKQKAFNDRVRILAEEKRRTKVNDEICG